jgi:hypothetical protein
MDARYASGGRALWLLLACVSLTSAHAQPSVRVRAGAVIELDAIRQGTLIGRLLDDLGEPIADRVVLLETLEPDGQAVSRRIAARSDAEGTFSVSMSGGGATLQVRASFAGDREHGAVQVERTIDRSRAEVQLRFVEPRSAYLDLAARGHGVLVRASSPLGGAGLALTLRDERGRTLDSGVTGEDGGLRVELLSEQLGEPGAGVLEASSDGDAERAATRVALPIVRFRHTALALSAERERERTRLHGTLRAGTRGLGGKAIGLFDGNRHVATVLTDHSGSFGYEVGPQRDGRPETWHVQARFASDAAWFGSSRSSMISVRIEPLRIPSALWLLLPALGLGALAVWLLRAPASERSRDARALPVGIHAERGRSAALGSRRDVGGSVRDARTGRAIGNAVISLTSASAPARTVHPERGGAFRVAELEPGVWRLAVDAPGYGEVASELSIPHRGQWADVQVRLPNLRDAALEVYRPVALNRIPSAELWGRWTAREVLASAAQAGRSNAALEHVTAVVERVAYGPLVPVARDLAEVESACDAALDPFGGRGKANG